jgi:hypothetical protein
MKSTSETGPVRTAISALTGTAAVFYDELSAERPVPENPRPL